jgi:uncharacterized repeat protein (TIGR03803 family)
MRAASNALALGGLFVLAVVAPNRAQAQRFQILYTFSGGADGGYPQNALIKDASGNLYGTTPVGGNQEGFSGSGVVFKLTPPAPMSNAWNETVLYTFTGGADGDKPQSSLVRDKAGNLYGTTVFGGIEPGGFGSGVVCRLDPAGNETVLHAFNYADGANPYTPLIRDSAGYLYGATFFGGSHGDGTVFKISITDQEKVLYAFSGAVDGAGPFSGLVPDFAGNLVGTTVNGGDLSGCSINGIGETPYFSTGGCGAVYKLGPRGHLTVLYIFSGGPDGANPYAGLIRDPAGNFYGTTWGGGAYGNGTVFKVNPAAQETVLYNFTGAGDGANPYGGVVEDAAGNLYGTANHGGSACGCGLVFMVDPTGNETILHTFDGGDGQYPVAGLLLVGKTLYGNTSGGGPSSGAGTVFKITLP